MKKGKLCRNIAIILFLLLITALPLSWYLLPEETRSENSENRILRRVDTPFDAVVTSVTLFFAVLTIVTFGSSLPFFNVRSSASVWNESSAAQATAANSVVFFITTPLGCFRYYNTLFSNVNSWKYCPASTDS